MQGTRCATAIVKLHISYDVEASKRFFGRCSRFPGAKKNETGANLKGKTESDKSNAENSLRPKKTEAFEKNRNLAQWIMNRPCYITNHA